VLQGRRRRRQWDRALFCSPALRTHTSRPSLTSPPFAACPHPRARRYGYRSAGDVAADAAAAAAAAPAGRRRFGPSASGAFDAAGGGPGPAQLEPLYLHAYSLVLPGPGGRPARVVAPLPPHMRALLAAQRWALPRHDAAGTSAGLRPARRRASGGDGAGGAAGGGGRSDAGSGTGMPTKRSWERWAGAAAGTSAAAAAAAAGRR
jgi:hypothetical protein